MGRKLFVGNLTFTTTGAELGQLFESVGTVESVTVVTDRETGRSRGFGFVEMGSQSEANRAVSELNGRDIDGRQINVSEAKERAPRDGGGGRRTY
jgi:RNA recognition motif-containing protein